MGKNKRKNRKSNEGVNSIEGWSSLPWEAINVNSTINDDGGITSTIAAPAKQDDDDDGVNAHEEMWNKNHYDDPETYDADDLYDPKDVEAEGFDEDPEEGGMFMGLEVIDGSQYLLSKKAMAGGAITAVVPTVREEDVTETIDTSGATVSTSTTTSSTKKVKQVGDSKQRTLERKREKRKLRRQAAQLRKKQKREDDVNPQPTEEPKEEPKEPNEPKEETPSVSVTNDTVKEVTKTPTPTFTNPTPTPTPTPAPTSPKLTSTSIQMAWSQSCGGVWLHPIIAENLARANFSHPTPIQASTLPAAILGKRDIVGAAPTGSGKTLAYGIPMIQSILTEQDNNEKVQVEAIKGLVLCPTRELAMQVTRELSMISGGSGGYQHQHAKQNRNAKGAVGVVALVGGMSVQKQKRLLDKRPAIVVGTPGRLWELMSKDPHVHFSDFSHLQYVVVDEADRMIMQNSFPQLRQIFGAVNKIQKEYQDLIATRIEDDADADEHEDDDTDRLKSLQGVQGEAKVIMLSDDVLRRIEEQRKNIPGNNEELRNIDDSSDSHHDPTDNSFSGSESMTQGDADSFDVAPPMVTRQTFVFSATLTLPSQGSNEKSPSSSTNKHNRGKGAQPVEGAIADILDAVGATNHTKVVDLSIVGASCDASNSQGISSSLKQKNKQSLARETKVRFPPGLALYEAKCTQMHKDSYCYAYLSTTRLGSTGPSLVFCNSIAAVRRLGETLLVLGLPVRTLHASKNQKSRLCALDSLRKPGSRDIVVATDVAARGLDIPAVSSVVHYDVPRSTDTFIHRSGRTARGVGPMAVGTSLSLVSPKEESTHRRICDTIRSSSRNENCSGSKTLEPISLDGRLLSAAQERMSLAAKIVSCEIIENQASKQNKWFETAAAECGFDLDDNMKDEGLGGGDNRDRQRLREAQLARQELKHLLAIPMRKQHFGKFLSGPGLSEAIRAESEVAPHVVLGGRKRIKKSAKKKA
eukprot:CAMPEP_0194369116 /NCGR_PEP_ID=MMETSP0174-20130528/17375_1 /TAXON_ID=216777 /ORGANISM="Proboscia alata, Strain PI-D3" /LENGTH=975 /DNA_ID=CAMNT_0039145853 /DNA_START=21 /DNA_END=2948 /DNA_ORIENTATION=+